MTQNDEQAAKAAADAAVAKAKAAVDARMKSAAADEAKAVVPAHPKDIASDHGSDEIFNFPCDFPIKVMGKTHPDYAETVMKLVEQFDPQFDRSKVETRPSSAGNYTGLTVTVVAQSRAQLDQIYLALTGHPMVSIVL
jgi:putative lipoic acid-binding regulatory protein